MKTKKIFLGVALIIMAIAIAAVPHFNTCQYHGRDITTATGTHVPMKCNWSAQAEIAVGATLLTVGILALVSRRKETLSFLSIIGIVLGVVTILIPTRIIGVCSSLMPCNTFMKPFLVAMGTLVVSLCVVGLVVLLTSKEKEA